MGGRIGDGTGDGGAHLLQPLREFVRADRGDAGIEPLGQMLEPAIDGQPGCGREHLPAIAQEGAPRAPKLQLGGQAVRERHLATGLPERAVARAQMVMEEDEVANALHLLGGLGVVFGDHRRIEALVGEELLQPLDAGLDQRDAGRFQRLQKSRGQAERDAVPRPCDFAPARREAQAARLHGRRAGDVGEQFGPRLVVALEIAREDEAVAFAAAQRDAPLPAGSARGDGGAAGRLAHPLALHRKGAVAQQPVRPVAIGRAQRLADQQAAKARAIDEQVARYALAAVERHRFDETGLAVERHIGDARIDARHPRTLGIGAHVRSETCGVEMERPVEHRELAGRIGQRHAGMAFACEHRAQRIFLQRRGAAGLARLLPILVEVDAAQVLPEAAKGVDEAGAGLPVDEADAELGGRLAGAHHFGIGHAERGVEAANGGDRRLADADRPDLRAFDQGDPGARPRQICAQRGRRHPPGGAPADDDDTLDRAAGHAPMLHRVILIVPASGPQAKPRRSCSRGKMSRRPGKTAGPGGLALRNGSARPPSNAARNGSANGTASNPCRTGSNSVRVRPAGSRRCRRSRTGC